MKSRKRDGVALAYEDIGSGSPPLLLVHGWCTDHSFFAPQIDFFGRNHRVVAVDLRGQGASDAHRQDYTMAGFVADLAWICGEPGLERPIVDGHSMGGTIALELAAAHPGLASAIMMIDSVILPPAQFMDILRPLGEALRGPGYLEPLTNGISGHRMDIDRGRAPSRSRPRSIAGEPDPARRPEPMGRTEGGNSVVTGSGAESAAIIDVADLTASIDDSDPGQPD